MEEMQQFFTKRADGYDEHMLNEVEGCKEAYTEMAKYVPDNCKDLLDLGCGTGLELTGIFKKLPGVRVTGIDITKAMLDKLELKFSDRNIDLICDSYFDVDLGTTRYDCAISFQTMHHFSHEKKTGLYTKIQNALRPGGLYIECDYMVDDQAEEDRLYADNDHIRKEMGINQGEFYHFDTPCTIDNQLKMFKEAGFKETKKVFRSSNTTIIISVKE